ncbi:hypothetical protein SPURM210S_00422 [Streptomyces purpurascens]
MFFKDKHCPNLLAAAAPRVFTQLRARGEEALRTHRTDLWRCTAPGWCHGLGDPGGGDGSRGTASPGANSRE